MKQIANCTYSVQHSLLFILIILLMVPASSCKKFLQAKSQNKAFLETAQDLDELLIGEGYAVVSIPITTQILFVMDDDVEENPVTVLSATQQLTNSRLSGFHRWQPAPYLAGDGSLQENVQTIFNVTYKKIAAANTIIFNVPLMREKGEPVDMLTRINGEAHFLRALWYFVLVNTYGKPYNKASADIDYGVPLKTTPEVEDGYFTRVPVKTIYDQIVNDLLLAEKDLEGHNEQSTMRAGQAAVQALLSRVFLYIEEYEKAAQYADKLIGKGYQFTNLNGYDNTGNFLKTTSPETIFNMGTNAYTNMYGQLFSHTTFSTADVYRASGSLLQSFTNEDLRPSVFFDKGVRPGQLYAKVKKSVTAEAVSDIYLIRLPEVYLNKAEALAILGHNNEAIGILEELRMNRFKNAPAPPPADQEALVTFIREERRRELCFEGHRWFDLRRYAVNSKFPFSKPIKHNAYAYNSSRQSYLDGYYELKPYSLDPAAYVVPLHPDEIEFNQGVLTNEERPLRPKI